MSKFLKYFLMKTNDVLDYAKENDFFSKDSHIECKEIGDGNLNYVFRVWDVDGEKSIILKQAGETARISENFKLSTDRNRIEAEILVLERTLTGGLVPIVYKYDPIMNCCVMEDLSSHTIMRQALINHEIFPLFSDHITTFLVNTLLLTSDIVMEHKEKKEMVKRYINTELCEITEDLVYSEPYNDYNGRNILFEPNVEFVKKEIYNDNKLCLEVAKLKFEFMNNAQCLLHGDLHTGSIFITKQSTMVIDPEFAFYGPMGYDIGNIVANMIFAKINGEMTMDESSRKKEFVSWVLKTIAEIIDMFKAKFMKTFNDRVTDVMAKEDGFDRWYLESVLKDTAAVAGLELIRRTVGIAKVKDITMIEDENKRKNAERKCLLTGKSLILNREKFMSGNDYLNLINEEY